MVVAWFAGASWACSMMPPEGFVVDPSLGDDLAPLSPELVAVTIDRGVGPRRHGLFGVTSTSCDDIGVVTIELARPAGDVDAADAVGYQLSVSGGVAPDGLEVSPGPWAGPDLLLTWIDGATDDQEPFAFTLAITPVDRAGNEGEALEVELADDGGAASSGCASSPRIGALGWLAPLALLRRRR